jgi:hypothetical protein
MGGDLLVVALFSLAFKFCNPAGMLPKLDVVTVNHSLGAFLRSFIIIAVEINRLNEVAVSANQVSSIVRHSWNPSYRRPEFAIEPTAHVGFHRIARNNHCVSTTALLAIERAIFES